MKYGTLVLLCVFCIRSGLGQDTFSIIAMDSTSRTVGSAGASCVDLVAYGIQDGSFLATHFPAEGGVHTQAAYMPANQERAKIAFQSGKSPQSILRILKEEDAEGNTSIRQYGLVRQTGETLQVAAFTGDSCLTYKGHITGNVDGWYYAIQGNILSGPHILEQMEMSFRSASGPMHCRLMQALQAAKEVGADTRCRAEVTSSLFAFLKVTGKPGDAENLSFSIDAKLPLGSGIEPIDSLQTLVHKKAPCP